MKKTITATMTVLLLTLAGCHDGPTQLDDYYQECEPVEIDTDGISKCYEAVAECNTNCEQDIDQEIAESDSDAQYIEQLEQEVLKQREELATLRGMLEE